jgi:hypothetical protein
MGTFQIEDIQSLGVGALRGQTGSSPLRPGSSQKQLLTEALDA